jgi:hypothetical protein
MLPTTPLGPRSSPAFARAIVLEPRPSRLGPALWLALHALLALAAALAALPWPVTLLAVGATVGHGLKRRPGHAPRRLVVGDNGVCRVADGRTLVLGRGTTVGAYWVRLVLTSECDALDILLLKDQLPADAWARLAAVLRRAQPFKSANGRSGAPDLR